MSTIGSKDDHPSDWDARVADLVRYVEEELDAEFDHPVPVRFLVAEEFDALVQTDESDLTEDDVQAARDAESVGRALGLFSGETDVVDESNDLAGSGILAYYSYDDQEIVAQVEDTEEGDLPVELQVTLVHELTHVWQDQRYDLGAVQDGAETTSQADAILGLIEGHATWVEDRYIDQLSDEDATEYEDAQADVSDKYTEATTGVTPALEASQAAPYVLGPAFVASLFTEDADLIDEAFTDRPPLAEDQLVLPSGYLDDDEPEDLDEPEVPKGSEEITRGQLGMPALYLMLTRGLPPTDALTAADGWGNDAFVLVRDDDRTCVRAAIVGDDTRATEQLEQALGAWAEAAPAETAAAVERQDDAIVVTACDPGPDVDQDVPGEDAIVQLFGRATDLASLLEEGYDVATAQCVVTEFYGRYLVADLTDASDLPQDEINAIFEECIG